MGISKSIKNIFGKTKKKKDDVAIGGVTTCGGVATHSDVVKSPKTKPKNRNRVCLSKKSMHDNPWIFGKSFCLGAFVWYILIFTFFILPRYFQKFLN